MRPLRGEFEPHEEIDEIRWVGLDGAAEALSYDHDRELLASFDASR
jgi:8-oxo-dGTP diphosphatase